jgi:hypothetical protein
VQAEGALATTQTELAEACAVLEAPRAFLASKSKLGAEKRLPLAKRQRALADTEQRALRKT